MAPRPEKIAFLHVPKTGGSYLEHRLAGLRPDDPHWFFSFAGLDSSKGGNRVVVEAMQPGDETNRRVLANPHFQEASVVAGHLSCNLERFFPGYRFRCFSVLRSPVERVVSNIVQYTWSPEPSCSIFARHRLASRVTSPGDYWRSIGEILRASKGGPIGKLLPHESMMLTNGMTRVLSGSPLHAFTSHVDLDSALRRAESIEIAWFSEYNASLSSTLAALGIELTLDEQNNPTGVGRPSDLLRHPKDYDCPDDIRLLIAQMNEFDIELYRALRKRTLA